MLATAVERERLAIASTSDGGIAQAFQTTVSLQKKAIYIWKYVDSLLVGKGRNCAFYQI